MTDLDRPRRSWARRLPQGVPCGPAYERFLEAFRELQDASAGIAAPDDALLEIEQHLRRATDVLENWQVSEWDRTAGTCGDLPGRGHPLLPPFRILEEDKGGFRGAVYFGQYYLGGNGAAHGGAVALLFDEVLGTFVNRARAEVGGDLPHRTAYLTVNYRNVTPVGVELGVDGIVERAEGRKCFVRGRLIHGDQVVADAEGLFIKLRPGMP